MSRQERPQSQKARFPVVGSCCLSGLEMKTMSQLKSESESASEASLHFCRTILSQLSEWSDLYRKPSDLLADSESCPRLRDCWAKTDSSPEVKRLLDQWIELGRPRIEWHECYQSVSNPR
jgi:hypothetical protein